VSDFIEWVPKHHGHQPLHWTPDMLTSVDGKSFVRQPNWAWIAGSVYYVPSEAVGMVREAVEPEPVVTDADRIEALTAENERLRTELLEWLDKTKWVRQTCQTHELGLHRADILRNRIEALTNENEQLLVSNEQWQVDYNEAVIDKLELETENERFRKALEEAPIIGLRESGEEFKSRQDNWLKTKAFPALGEKR
jgi:hypothetical protein